MVEVVSAVVLEMVLMVTMVQQVQLVNLAVAEAELLNTMEHLEQVLMGHAFLVGLAVAVLITMVQ